LCKGIWHDECKWIMIYKRKKKVQQLCFVCFYHHQHNVRIFIDELVLNFKF
jgi:hypothetical protein